MHGATLCYGSITESNMAIPKTTTYNEIENLKHKLRMIISHASGGHLSKPTDLNRSVNDICVEISRHHNRIWQHAREGWMPIPKGPSLPEAPTTEDGIEEEAV